MRVVGMYGLVGGDVKSCAFAFQFPKAGSIPLGTVEVVVLEVAVLDEFGIKSAIGTIVNILEENSDEIGGDGFGEIRMYVERCFEVLDSLETGGIVAHRFAILLVTLRCVCHTKVELSENVGGDAIDGARDCVSLNVEGDTTPGVVVLLFGYGLCGAPLTEVGTLSTVVIPCGSGVCDDEMLALLVELWLSNVVAGGHVGIVLGFPEPEVGGTCSGKLVGTLVELPYGIELSVDVENGGAVHPFFCSPGSVVTGDEVALRGEWCPTLAVVAVGNTESSLSRGCLIGEQINRIGAIGLRSM